MSEPLVSARALGRELGVAHTTILEMYRKGIIDADIHEGVCIRFDAAKVREALAKRAKENRNAVKIPTGMVPTY